MKTAFTRILLTAAIVAGVYFAASSFFVSNGDGKQSEECDKGKCSDSKIQSGAIIKSLSRHLLDFNR